MDRNRASLATLALTAFRESGVDFALLHGEERLAAGEVPSDIDLATDRPHLDLLKASAAALACRRLFPILDWPYDVGGASVWVVDESATASIQLDLLHDPRGHGTYGVRTGTILARKVRGARWPKAHTEDERAYLLVKRSLKKNEPALRVLKSLPGGLNTSCLSPRSARIAQEVSATGKPASTKPGPSVFHDVVRKAQRVLRPSGYVVFMPQSSTQAVAALAGRLHLLLPRVSWSTAVDGQGQWGLASVSRAKLMAGVHLTNDPTHSTSSAIELSDTGSTEANARDLVSKASLRLLGRAR